MRSYYVVDIPYLRFKPLLHAHSHVAMLGWLFIALMVFLLEDTDRQEPRGRTASCCWCRWRWWACCSPSRLNPTDRCPSPSPPCTCCYPTRWR
ncbi:MAG: hypothetical protein IPK99_06985 [Flavobacteriales bacterium]|nr:hypothetical protein [Flavobacteriales bacterium]